MSLNNAHEGYDYQDLITSYFILKEILNGNLDSRFSIDRKNTEADTPDRFDDLVIINGDNIQRKQVKYSNEHTATKLIKDYLSADSYYKIAIHQLYESWKALKTNSSEFRLCLAWEEPTEHNIKNVLDLQSCQLSSFSSFPTKVFKINLDRLWEIDPEKFNRWDSLKRYVKSNNIDRDEFNNFCNDLLIEVNLPKASLKFDNPSELENILIKQAKRLGIEQYPNDDIYITDFLLRLAKIVGRYRTRSSIVSVQEVLKELRVKTDFGKIEQKFELDQSVNVTSDEKYSLFHQKTITNRKTILTGEPGSGKSWFLTNFIDYLERKKKLVLRHYCFTSTEDELIDKRVSSNAFFGNLISDIEKAYPKLTKKKRQIFAANLDELNLLLKEIKDPLIIIVDGLDHIKRVLSSSVTLSEEKTRILDYISKILLPDNITMILGSQPVDELTSLKDNFEYIEEKIPKWDVESTKELMYKYGYKDLTFGDTHLSSLLYDKSEGSPLYLTYILLTLNVHDEIAQEHIESLPKYDFNLKNYYEYLTSQIKDNVTAEILSCLEFSVNRKELKEIIPIKHHFDSNMKLLSPVVSENVSRGGIKLYHDSFRRFNIEKLSTSADLDDIYKYIVDWLNLGGFYRSDKSYRYLFNYLIKMKKYDDISHFAKNKFLAKSLYYAHPESLIKNNYESFLYVAHQTQDWPLFIYAGELKRAIETTSSEEHYSQFLQNFELYFEAVCLIYGTNKANSLLYFNGEKNHSDAVTAQAFRILEKHGFSPKWEDIVRLFTDGVKLDDFRYYIGYLAQDSEKLSLCFKKIVSEGRDDFTRVFIEEVYELKDFGYIVELYNELNSTERDSTTKLINNALGRTSCNQRISVARENDHSDLQPLSLDFISNAARYEKFTDLYFQVERYASIDIEKLVDFEKTIPVHSFTHKWVKFFIRNFIVEANCDSGSIEEGMLRNIKFLASGHHQDGHGPRYSSFIYQNSSIIDVSLEKAFSHISLEESWSQVFAVRTKIPYPIIPTIERRFLSQENISHIIEAYNDFDREDDDDYSEHAEYSFKKSIYYAKVGKMVKAKEELKKAIHLTTSYTYRKDRNLAEVIDPLLSVKKLNPKFARKYTKKLKYLTDAVMKHTEDGKDTRWLTIEWFEVFLKVDYYLASKYLINELLTNGNFWKLEYMFVDLLLHSNKVEPYILNFLYKLSPTNTKESYLNGFLDVIDRLNTSDRNVGRLSMINLSSRDWNNSYDTLSTETMIRYNQTSRRLGLNVSIDHQVNDNNVSTGIIGNRNLSETISKQLCIEKIPSLKDQRDLIEYLVDKDTLEDHHLNFLYFYLKEDSNIELANEILLPIIRKRFPRGHEHYENIRYLITRLNIPNNDKISLYINNFVYSKDGWYSGFTDKDSLRFAVETDKGDALKELAKTLPHYYSNADFISKSTANLIIAFEYSGLNETLVLPMYKKGFKFIESRLPNKSNFKWGNLDYLEFCHFNDNELAIILALSKTNSFDSSIQKDVISALSYIIRKDVNILIKPLNWFFNNLEFFHQLTIASILELLSIESRRTRPLIFEIKASIEKARVINNLYINNILDDILGGLINE
ncbi:ATP-binding protein [Vibrio parahaemolyticus]